VGSSKLPLSPAVSQRLPTSTTGLSLLPNPHPQIEHGTDTKEALEQLQGSITEAKTKVFEVKKGLDSKAGFKDLQAHLDMVSEQLKVSSSKNPQVRRRRRRRRKWRRRRSRRTSKRGEV